MIYCFKCFSSEGGCEHRFDVVAEMSEIIGLKPKCPKCRKKSSVFRDYEGEQVTPYDPTPKTLGSLAEQNTTKFSKEKRQEMTRKFNEYLENPYTGPMPTNAIPKDELIQQSDTTKNESKKTIKSSSTKTSSKAKKSKN